MRISRRVSLAHTDVSRRTHPTPRRGSGGFPQVLGLQARGRHGWSWHGLCIGPVCNVASLQPRRWDMSQPGVTRPVPPARPQPRRPGPGPATGRGPGRGIIVLNGNFAPASAAGPFKYGAVAYALKAAGSPGPPRAVGRIPSLPARRRVGPAAPGAGVVAPVSRPSARLSLRHGPPGVDRRRGGRPRPPGRRAALLPDQRAAALSPVGATLRRHPPCALRRPRGRGHGGPPGPKRPSGPDAQSWSTCATASASDWTVWSAAAVPPWRSRRSRPTTCGCTV